MQSFIFGKTATHLPIPAYRFGNDGPRVLLLGGVHGDEIEGVWAGLGLLQEFSNSYSLNLKLTLVPGLNMDGVLNRKRTNGNGVDLNRNMPTKDWSAEIASERYHPGPKAGSEPESQALVEYLDRENPQFILSLHSWKPLLNINGDCRKEAEAIHALTGYTIEETIGYPTPGCLGTYAGLERKSPTLTYEIERGLDQVSVLKTHVPAVIAGLRAAESRRK
jgi:protein MpaA